MYKGEKREGEYVRTIISGDIDSIPVKIKRKRADVRRQNKDHLVYGFTIQEVGIGDYYGFSLDGNHRYLLGDFSVTHNTTMALAAARTFEYEPLEINASRSLRSHEDVISLRDSCMAPVSFTSFLKYAKPRKTCVILDEIDGSDPHAQRKVLEWIRDTHRVVPIICTSNEVPVIFKRAPEHITLHRCMPLNARDIYENLQAHAPMEFTEFQKIVKECQHDVRRLMNRFQYGQSDTLHQIPLTGDTIADLFKHQETFYGVQPTYWDL
jgi:DNA polymerase III delta prime subunit